MDGDNDCNIDWHNSFGYLQLFLVATVVLCIASFFLVVIFGAIFFVSATILKLLFGTTILPEVVLVTLLSIVVICYLIIRWNNSILHTASDFIEKYPESGSEGNHHALIIAHEHLPNFDGIYDMSDYQDGIDILVKKFRSCTPPVNYKIYEVSSREEIIPVILDPKTEYLWIFGNGKRNLPRFPKGNLCYYEVRDAPRKKFIGQYHWNSWFGKSLADYNKPECQEVGRWPRFFPVTRCQVRRHLVKLKI